MKELKDYIVLQKLTGMSDIEIITSYFIDNNIEEEAMELSHNLAKAKIKKMKHRIGIIETWAYYIPSEHLYKKYSVKTATMLNRIWLDYIINEEVTGDRLKWAEENIPNIKIPVSYFRPLIEWLDDKGIRFKDEQPIEDKMFI